MTTMNEELAAIEAAYAGVAEGGLDSVKDMGIKMFQAGAAWQRAQGAVPDGYALVPVEPTAEMMMHESSCQHHAADDMSCPVRRTRRNIWARMLAAAPTVKESLSVAPTVKTNKAQPEVAENTGSHAMANQLQRQGLAVSTEVDGAATPSEASDADDRKCEAPNCGCADAFCKAWPDHDDAAPAAKAEQPDMVDAYVGAREDLAIWKRRALEAEEKLRNAEQSTPAAIEVIGYASPGQVEILRKLPRTGGMKVKGCKDGRYTEPVVLLSAARAALFAAVIRCEQAGAFKACMECGYQDGHDEICKFHGSNRAAQDQGEVQRLREALEEIADPIKFMRARLEDGEQLNGVYAIQMAESGSYLREIAKRAIAASTGQEV